MAHIEQVQYCQEVSRLFKEQLVGASVLDLGSLDINGNNRQYFPELSEYVGVDLAPGPNVDVVSRAHDLDAPDGSYDVVISTEMFEHDRYYRESISTMLRLLKPGGLMIFTCATIGRNTRGTAAAAPNDSPHTLDHYRNLTEADFRAISGFSEAFSHCEFRVNDSHKDLQFYGVKRASHEEEKVPSVMGKKVDVILVKYNQPDYEAKAIKAVAEYTTYSNYSITAYQNDKGVGLAKAWNMMISKSNADFICLLNTDTVVTTGWLTRLMNTFDLDPKTGAVCPSANAVAYNLSIPIPFSRMEMDEDVINTFAAGWWDKHADEIRINELLSGMCILFPRKIWEEVGGFDESFYLYGEDTDFTNRVRKAGYRLIYRKGVYVHHYKARSVEQAAADGEFDINELRKRAQILWEQKK